MEQRGHLQQQTMAVAQTMLSRQLIEETHGQHTRVLRVKHVRMIFCPMACAD